MFDYIDYFKLEAKCLLKDFHKKDSSAIKECQKYFGTKSDLTLMNMQHVIAKRYGFNSWDDVIKKDNAAIAETLIAAKNKNFTSPFSTWHDKTKWATSGENCKFERTEICDSRLSRFIDDNNKIVYLGYGKEQPDVINKSHYPLDVNLMHANVSQYDFSNLEISRLLFNEERIWPQNPEKMPKGLSPKEFIASRKKPCFGIRKLHLQGITGQSRNIAIISESKMVNHFEYHNNIVDYMELGAKFDNNGGAVAASIAVGAKCGVAPKANLYCYAVSRTMSALGQRLVDYAFFCKKYVICISFF